MARKKKTKYEKVAKYLSDHPLSAPKNVAKACKCSVKYVYNIRSQSGTPKEVFEREAEANTKTSAVSDRTLERSPLHFRQFYHGAGCTYHAGSDEAG